MARMLKIYTLKEGHLDDWSSMWAEQVAPLRRSFGFETSGYRVPAQRLFVWMLEWPGTEEEFAAADAAYYEQPEHGPLQAKGAAWIESAQQWFLDPVQ